MHSNDQIALISTLTLFCLSSCNAVMPHCDGGDGYALKWSCCTNSNSHIIPLLVKANGKRVIEVEINIFWFSFLISLQDNDRFDQMVKLWSDSLHGDQIVKIGSVF